MSVSSENDSNSADQSIKKRPLESLNAEEVVLLLPQLTPSRWHDAFRSARISGKILNSLKEISEINGYKINFKKMEFESFMNRLAVYKKDGVSETLLMRESPVKSDLTKRQSVVISSQTVASRRDVFSNASAKPILPPSTPRKASVGDLLPPSGGIINTRAKALSVADIIPNGTVSNIISSSYESGKTATPRPSITSGTIETSPTPRPPSPARAAAMDPSGNDNVKKMTRRMSMTKISIFEKKGKTEEITIISMADRENLLKASAEGNNPFIQNQIDKKIFDGLSRHGDGRTTVMLAAAAGRAETISLLLNQPGMDVILNTKDRDGNTALMLAADKGQVTALEILLAQPNIDVGHKNKDGKSAMFLAFRHESCVRILINFPGVYINEKDGSGITPLMAAIRGNQSSVVQLILSHPAVSINEVNNEGRSTLMEACRIGAVPIIELILKCTGLNVNIQDTLGMTALILAVKGGHITAVQLLIQRSDINVNITEKTGLSALALAMREAYTDIVFVLLRVPGIDTSNVLVLANKAQRDLYQQMLLTQTSVETDVNIRDQSGNTALIVAANEGKKDTVALLLQQPAIAVNAQDKHGNTPLMLATKKGKKEIIDMLLAHPNINPNIQDRHGTTALMTAARKDKVPIVQSLLNHPATLLNLEDASGYTALIIASGEGNSGVVDVLLQHPQVDVNAKDRNGRTTLMLASQQGKSNIVELMLKHPDTLVNETDDDFGWSALMIASYNGNAEIVSLLLSHENIDVNVTDNYLEDTAFILALRNGNEEVIHLLLQHPTTDLNIQAKDGATALTLASNQGMVSTVRNILKNPTFLRDYEDIYHKYTDIIGWDCKTPYLDIVELLLAEDPDVDLQRISDEDENAEPLLITAIRGRHKDIVQLMMLQPTVDTNVQDAYGRTPLMIAARLGYKDLVDVLLKDKSVDINVQDIEGCTALMGAIIEKQEHMARFLMSLPEVDIHLEELNGRTALSLAKELGLKNISV